MAFKVFEAYGAASRPEATLRASGYLFLSKGILKRAGDEQAKAAQLLFDEDEDKLGIRLVDLFTVNESQSQTVREMSHEKSGAAVNITPLMRYYRFPTAKQLGKRILPVDFDRDMIVIDMKELRTVNRTQLEQGEDQ